MASNDDRQPGAAIQPGRKPFEGLVGRARLAIAWERAWPRLAVPLGVAFLFVATAWFGAFEALPFSGRIVLLGVFVVAGLASLYGLAGLRAPSVADGLRRLDRDAGVAHRPATALSDTLATAPDDPVSQALWAAHRRDAERKARSLRLAMPSPGLPGLDRYAVRIGVVLALVVSFFYAGPERTQRLMAAFQPASAAPAADAAIRIDAWVTPPAYTRRAPLLLTQDRAAAPIPVAQGSVLVVRVAGDASASVSASGDAVETAGAAGTAPPAAAGLVERRLTLHGNAVVAVARGGKEALRLTFAVIPDLPPTIAFAGPVKGAARGAMTLTYKVEDDYGATGAEAEIALPPAEGRPLYDPPKVALALPSGRARSGVASATRDVSDHPFAGARVRMTLVARDDAGNVGRSPPEDMVLPGRTFVKPLARALVEQRRLLAMDANQAGPVRDALEALMIAPEDFTRDLSAYLGLRTAWVRLGDARNDDGLRDVVQYLWQIALRIEEGDLSDAERQLKAAQQRLRDALERGADPEEIARLTQELRQALNTFLDDYAQKLAQQNRDNPKDDRQSQTPSGKAVTPEDLNRMLDQMETMAKNGSRDEAQQLLSDLNDILENLQSPGQSETAQDPAMREMERALNEMGAMIQRQQTLRDQTFQRREGREGNAGNEGQKQPGGEQQQGQQGEGRQPDGSDPGGQQAGRDGAGEHGGLQGLRERQESLRQQLEAMRKRLDEMGVPGGEELDQAEQAMRDAEGRLGDKDGEGAVGSQGKAIEALRRGAKGMAAQMQEAQQGQDGQGGEGQGRPGRAQRTGRGTGNGGDRDPLGRPTRSRGYSDGSVKVPGRGESDVERATRVLDELRRRLSDPARPRLELDYIDRLLRRQ